VSGSRRRPGESGSVASDCWSGAYRLLMQPLNGRIPKLILGASAGFSGRGVAVGKGHK
jgi:hypothetical protein